MVVAMNSITLPLDQNMSAYIAGLCDVVPNKKRNEKDFLALHQCLEHTPKECTPFKGKILLHIRNHALANPGANIRLLASCFAKATLLYRKTPNKSEGPLGCWKSGLKEELLTLEENLNQLYGIVGLNTTNILSRNSNELEDEDDCLKSHEKLSESTLEFESIINEYVLRINLAAHNICALISTQTDFDLPIPVFIILKLSAKIGLIRWKDYKKKPNGLLKNYVYSLAPCLLDTNLMLFKSLVTVLGTNIIPFTGFINQTLIRILEWTRSSNLSKYYEDVYHTIRSQVFKMITFMAGQLSLNLNLEPQQLKALLVAEIVDNLEELLAKPERSGSVSLKDSHVVDALECLENLLIIYRDLLDASLESKCKGYVIQTCLAIYRDFSSNGVGQACRRRLLELLQTIANQPYATSTTEISYHVFELADRFEGDPEIRSLARRSLKIGLAHRPTIVTHHDVYDCYGRPMSTTEDSSSLQFEQLETTPLNSELMQSDQQASQSASEPAKPDSPKPIELDSSIPTQSEPVNSKHSTLSEPEPALPAPTKQNQSSQEQAANLDKGAPSNGIENKDVCRSPDSDIMIIEQNRDPEVESAGGVAGQDEDQADKEDSEIQSMLSHFVAKRA